jgi:hypothetical protein
MRVKFSALAIALLLAAQGCSDGGTAPEPKIDAVVIGGGAAVNLTVGDTVRLAATVGDDRGGTVTDATVAWRSTAEAVASVTSSGLVTALTPGATKIIASAEGFADTVDVTVQAKPVASCTTPLSMAVGAVQQVSAASAACLGGVTGSEYVVVGFNGQETASLPLTVEGGGASTSLSMPRAASFDVSRLARRPTRDLAFEMELRRRERAELPRYLPALQASIAQGGLRPRLSLSAAVPAVGDLLTLNTSLDACAAPASASKATGRVAAVTTRAIVVTDTANPAGGFTDDEYREIGVTFDTLVYAEDVRNFGEPQDIDANARVIIFYTKAVNAMTEPNSQAYVGGFFYARDLFPTTAQPGFQACAGSNYAEMFYVLAPDPNGQVNNNKRAKDQVRDITLATIAHELQHLILASRRLYGLRTSNWDEVTWLNEGLSHIAEELVFYRASGLTPKVNIDSIAIRAQERRRLAFNEYAIDNFGRYDEYLKNTEEHSPYVDNDELEDRGAIWSFLRYAADRVSTNQTTFWNRLVNSSEIGMANLRNVLGQDPIPLVRDWAVSVYTDDFVPGAGANYQQPSWNTRSVITVLERGSFPLRTRTLTNGSTALTLEPGGATFIRVAPSGSGVASVVFRSAGITPPDGFSVMVIRTK